MLRSLPIGINSNNFYSLTLYISSACAKPIHIWVIIDLFLIGLLRYMLGIMEKTQSRQVFRTLAGTILIFYFPLFMAWTVYGTMWYGDVYNETPTCVDENRKWIAVFWISVSYFLCFTYFATVLTIAIDQVS